MASSGPIFDSQNGDGFLVAQFQDFYTEVLRLKSQVLRSGWAVDGERRDTDFDEGLGTSVADEPTDEGAWPAAFGEAQREEVAPSAVWQVLVGLLTRQGREARRVGGDLAGEVFSRAQLLEQVWQSSPDWQDPATVTVHVRRIRNKIEADPENPEPRINLGWILMLEDRGLAALGVVLMREIRRWDRRVRGTR